MKITHILFLTFSISAFIGCSSGRKSQPTGESGARISHADVQVEAYLFDVKLRRKGKPTTVRLDLYQTDSVVAMYGRGYFNKGAFSGRITDDSMLIYFPSTNEYLNESIENLFLSFDCESELIGINLLGYFIVPPDSAQASDNLSIQIIEESEEVKQYRVSSKSCPWRLLLGYRKEKNVWRLEMIEFDDSENVTLKATRRQYKSSATVSSERFYIQIKPDALKISL